MALVISKYQTFGAVTAAASLALGSVSTAQAEADFNIGVFTDYIDDGASKSDNDAVVQGGFDLGVDADPVGIEFGYERFPLHGS